MSRLQIWVAALWWASLTTIGFLVVPMLFVHLPTPAMAGGMAAKLFTSQTWVSSICGLVLLLLIKNSNQPPTLIGRAQVAMLFIVAGMIFALLSEFAVAPRIVARDNLRFWHSVGSILYLLQWLCAAVTFGKLMPPRQAD